jgi:cell wall-associated NlpC family hydrolase
VASQAWRPTRRTAHAPTIIRALRSIVTTALSATVALGLVFAGSTAAHAEPSIADMERQLDQAWNNLEPVIERHNAVRADLNGKRKQAAALQKKIQPLQLQVDLAMTRVGEFAAESYKGGNTSAINALLASGSPADFADRLALLNEYAKEQQARIKDVVALKGRYDSQKAPLDALVSQLARSEADLAKQQSQIDDQIKRLQALRLKAYGQTGAVGNLRPAACPYEYIGGAGGVATKFACQQIGKPYVWAADGPNAYDCSGLTLAAWAKAGVSLPHNALQQSRTVRSVSRSELRPGDLVFYYSDVHHVAIYVGGVWVVHASRAGEPVRMRKIDVGPIHSYGRPG